MAADDARDPNEDDSADEIEPADVRAELDRQRSRAGSEQFDDALVELFSRMLDTDTRARIYVHLRRKPHSTVEEIVEGTGLYPSAVNRVLTDLHDEEVVERTNRGSDDPAYTAIGPDELVDVVVGQVRDEFEKAFGLDRLFGGGERERSRRTEPVTIPVEEAEDADDRDDQ